MAKFVLHKIIHTLETGQECLIIYIFFLFFFFLEDCPGTLITSSLLTMDKRKDTGKKTNTKDHELLASHMSQTDSPVQRIRYIQVFLFYCSTAADLLT